MSTADETKEETEPANPRRAPDVVNALAQAARRDPPRDVLKPIGRACFLISLIVLAWLCRPLIASGPHMSSSSPLAVFSRAAAIFTHMKDVLLSIDGGKLLHLDLEPRQASMLMLAGLFGFGFYYLSVYLVAMNALRFTAGVGAVADATMRRARRIAGRLRKPKSDDAERPLPQADGAAS